MSIVATLAGVPLTCAQRYRWPLSAGTRPQQQTFETSASCAAKIMAAAGGPVALHVESAGHPPLDVAGLYVIGDLPGSMPFTRKVIVTDSRWLLGRKAIVRDFNLRRRTGETRLVGEGRLENKELIPTVKYAPWSLNNGAAWKPEDCLRSVLTELVGGNFSMPDKFSRKIEVEDLALNHPGDQAVRMLLGYLAGYEVTVDPDGRLRVFDSRDGSEGAMIAVARKPLRDGPGVTGDSDRSFSRPVGVNVLLEREVELRFDFVEGEDLSTVARDREPRKLENVAPVTDPTLAVNGQTLTQGTWAEITKLMAAFGSSALGKTLTQDYMRKNYLGNWSAFSNLFTLDANGFPDPIWVKRMSAIRGSWRRVFRILPQWMQKIRSVRAYRVAVLDTTWGTRAPAEAFMDYITKPSERGLAKKVSQNTDIGKQVAGYAASLKDGKSAPVDISVKDEDNGVIRVWLATDPFGEAEEIAPGNVEKMPSYDPAKLDANSRGDVLALYAAGTLKSNFKMALVVSCIQACPNNSGRYHKESVSPSEAGAVLGLKVGNCSGPAVTIILGGGIQTARFAWSDDDAAAIESAFYDGAEYPKKLLTNAESIRALAKAAAARIYATMLDRVEGEAAYAINPALKVTGSIAVVEHAVETNGAAISTVIVTPELQPIDETALLPASVQRVVRRMVQP